MGVNAADFLKSHKNVKAIFVNRTGALPLYPTQRSQPLGNPFLKRPEKTFPEWVFRAVTALNGGLEAEPPS